MRRTWTLVGVALLAAGCATTSSVKQQVDPLAERIAALEKQNAELRARLAEVTAKAQALAETDAKEQATQVATDDKVASVAKDVEALRNELAATGAVAKDAQAAAAEARAATARAEIAASKAAKSFELQQKKGR